MSKEFYDDGAFYIQEKVWGTWDSYDKFDKCIVTSLTKEDCIDATRFFLKGKLDGWNDAQTVVKSENSTVGGKL